MAFPSRAVLVFLSCSRTELDVIRPDPSAAHDGAAPDAPTCSAEFGSGPAWSVYGSDGALLGAAQPVCLTADSPPGCPNHAYIWQYAGNGWMADITSLGGAQWIWSPTASRTDFGDLAQFAFVRTVTLPAVESVSLSIAADDFASVEVNGTTIGSLGSISDGAVSWQAQSALTTFDITSALVVGDNTIRVVGQNGAFGTCGGPCDYMHNPAGDVFAVVVCAR